MKNKISKILSIFFIIILILSFYKVEAKDKYTVDIKKKEYSEEYQNWQKLSDEEKSKVMEPRRYEVKSESNTTYLNRINNLFRVNQLMKASLENKYDLRTVVPENSKVKDQQSTNTCWAFATLGTLETTLAVNNKNNSKTAVEYDFSERHLDYATSRNAFLNNMINKYGFSRKSQNGGNFYIALAYLTNGQGAINEADMPFENNSNDIDISKIQNKEVKTTLYDTVEFNGTSKENKNDVIQTMKQHIMNYGGIYAGIIGESVLSNDINSYYNNATAALYCNQSLKYNHAVTIVGWDDDFKKENFKTNCQPSSNGAWIIKNSWGESISKTMSEVKQLVFAQKKQELAAMGITNAESIPDNIVLTGLQAAYGTDKVKLQDGKVSIEVGDKGYMYVSYEDAVIYTSLSGIQKVSDTKDYDNIYQHDLLGGNVELKLGDSSTGDIFLANVFKRDSNEEETLDKVSIYNFSEYTYKIMINPNSDSKAKSDLQNVSLKQGDTVTLKPGFHVLELSSPVTLTGDSFVVVAQVVENGVKEITIESKEASGTWKEAEINTGESFYATSDGFAQNKWSDMASLEGDAKGNLCIKAYTTKTNKPTTKKLNSISIEKSPDKISYTEGDNFDKTGMKIVAKYDDNTSNEITNYEIIGGNNLTADTKTVTISYTENGVTKTVTQSVTVTKKAQSEEKEPELSNFNNANAIIKKMKIYKNSKNAGNDEVTIEISGIEIGNTTNKYTYYYHLSGTQGDTNITNWKTAESKIVDGKCILTINAKSQDLDNFSEIVQSDNLYVYIKEMAELGQYNKEQVKTLSAKKDDSTEIYIEDEKIGNVKDLIDNGSEQKENTNNTMEGETDKTVAKKILPRTGSTMFKVLLLCAIMIFGGFTFYRYKNIDK